MAKPVVAVVDIVYRKAPEVFDGVDFADVVLVPPEEEAVAAAVRSTGAIAVVLGTQPYRAALYESLPAGGLVARFGVGYDGIDLARAAGSGLLVTNTPGVLESTVAESTVFLTAELLRRMGHADSELKAGRWEARLGEDLGGKTWAIVGLGRIGTALGRMLTYGFGLRVLGVKRGLSDAQGVRERSGAVLVTDRFEQVAAEADILSLHLPAVPETRHFLDSSRLAKMKPGAIVVNTGRGSLVDEAALYDALETGRLGGAALDVFAHEPYRPVSADKDLRMLPNVVLTPHISSSTRQCAARIARRVIANIHAALQGEKAKMDLVGS